MWATTRCGRSHLEANGIEVAGVAPPGVDREVFRPNPQRSELRGRAGFAKDDVVVGVFATNTERKQLPRALRAFAGAVARLPDRALRLYMHCAQDGCGDLLSMAAELNLSDQVTIASHTVSDQQRGIGSGSYVDRLNCCDVIVNLPYSGDVEQAILEAQACEIPLVHTADGGVMSEALGAGGIALPAAATEQGPLGETRHFVDPEAAAEAIASIVVDGGLAAELRSSGNANVTNYGWEHLEEAACLMVEPFITTENS